MQKIVTMDGQTHNNTNTAGAGNNNTNSLSLLLDAVDARNGPSSAQQATQRMSATTSGATPTQHQAATAALQQLSSAGANVNATTTAYGGATANSFAGATSSATHHGGLSLLHGARDQHNVNALSQLHVNGAAPGTNMNDLLGQNMNLVQRERLAAALMYEQQQQAAQVEAQLRFQDQLSLYLQLERQQQLQQVQAAQAQAQQNALLQAQAQQSKMAAANLANLERNSALTEAGIVASHVNARSLEVQAAQNVNALGGVVNPNNVNVVSSVNVGAPGVGTDMNGNPTVVNMSPQIAVDNNGDPMNMNMSVAAAQQKAEQAQHQHQQQQEVNAALNSSNSATCTVASSNNAASGGASRQMSILVPCRARGMPVGHNPKTAHFRISEHMEHGAELICSYPACRSAGVKFCYCAYCQTPVAKRNFRKRHMHKHSSGGSASAGGTSSTPGANDEDRSVSVAGDGDDPDAIGEDESTTADVQGDVTNANPNANSGNTSAPSTPSTVGGMRAGILPLGVHRSTSTGSSAATPRQDGIPKPSDSNTTSTAGEGAGAMQIILPRLHNDAAPQAQDAANHDDHHTNHHNNGSTTTAAEAQLLASVSNAAASTCTNAQNNEAAAVANLLGKRKLMSNSADQQAQARQNPAALAANQNGRTLDRTGLVVNVPQAAGNNSNVLHAIGNAVANGMVPSSSGTVHDITGNSNGVSNNHGTSNGNSNSNNPSSTLIQPGMGSSSNNASAAIINLTQSQSNGGSANNNNAQNSNGSGSGGGGPIVNEEKLREWIRLLFLRPTTEDNDAMSRWLMQVLAISGDTVDSL